MDYRIICVRLTCEDCILHVEVNFYMWGSTITRGCRLLQVRKKYFMYGHNFTACQPVHGLIHYCIHGSTTYTGQLLHTRIDYYMHKSTTACKDRLQHE